MTPLLTWTWPETPLAILVIGSVIGVIMIGIILAITSANDIAV